MQKSGDIQVESFIKTYNKTLQSMATSDGTLVGVYKVIFQLYDANKSHRKNAMVFSRRVLIFIKTALNTI